MLNLILPIFNVVNWRASDPDNLRGSFLLPFSCLARRWLSRSEFTQWWIQQDWCQRLNSEASSWYQGHFIYQEASLLQSHPDILCHLSLKNMQSVWSWGDPLKHYRLGLRTSLRESCGFDTSGIPYFPPQITLFCKYTPWY